MRSRRWHGQWLSLASSLGARSGRLAFAIALTACGARTGLDSLGVAAPVDAASYVARDVSLDAVRDVSNDTAPIPTGCADGDREGFVDIAAFPDIAGCSGGWSVPGVMLQNPGRAPECPSLPTFDTVSPACGRMAGNDGPNPDGRGCNVADLCANRWHVCTGAADVESHSPSGCAGATRAGDPPLFFTSRQSTNGCYVCATGTTSGPECNSMTCATGCVQTAETSNDVFGCGSFGDPSGDPDPFVDCSPLDRSTFNECTALGGSTWSCTDDGSGFCEAFAIVHGGADHGGALCCRD